VQADMLNASLRHVDAIDGVMICSDGEGVECRLNGS